MLTLDMPLEEARSALELAKVQLATRVIQLSNCRVCGADLPRYEQALGTVRQMLSQLEPADAVRVRES